MKHGVREWAFVTAFLALAAVGAVAIFGDEIRGALGVEHRVRPDAARGSGSGLRAPAPAGRRAP